MKEKIVLKSTHPSEYPDLVVECRVIPNGEIGSYLSTIKDEEKFYASKTGKVEARTGVEGEQVKTTLKTIVDGREYILSEEENTVKSRDGVMDIVVKNVSSTSNEEYVVKGAKFSKMYTPSADGKGFVPVSDSRLLTRVSENVIIMTLWGAPAVCLAGSYIVTYNADENDYNTLEAGAFNSTYTKDENKKVKRN